jgi:hypothetical protein
MDPETTGSGADVLQDLHETPGANARDLAPPQIQALRDLFANPDVGLWWFCREVFGFKDMVWDFHGEPCQLVGHWGESHLADGRVITTTPAGGYEEDNIVDSYRRIMIRIPRETFKTSCFTRGMGLLTLARDPEATLGIFNETQDKPIQWIDAIRQVVENSVLFQTLYRDIIPKGIGFWDREAGITTSRKLKWGGTGMRFERGSYGVSELSIEPHGITGTAVGKHFTHMIWDDIIGLKAAQSAAIMENAIEWVDNSRAIERPLEGGCVLVNHTTWAFHDVYRHMEQKWPGEWQIFHRSLLENPETGEPDDVFGVSTFPSKISTKKAHRMRDTDNFVFAAQYQCIPKAGRDQAFDPADNGAFHIVWEGKEPVMFLDKTGRYDEFNGSVFELDMEDAPHSAPQVVPLSWCAKCIIIDPAPAKQAEIRANRHANNAMVVCAVDPWGRRFNLEARTARVGPEEILEQMVAMARTWQAWVWSVEEVTFSALYQPLWSTIMSLREDLRDCNPEWHPVSPEGRDKHARIRNNLMPLSQAGLLYYNMGHPESQMPGCPSGYLLKELEEFPNGQVIDTIDAWSYLGESVQKPPTPEARQAAWYRRKSDPGRGITGYGEMTFERS